MASFAEQFGIRLEIEDISWPEYCKLFCGISGETALGRIISTRSESDQNIIKNFTPEQRKIRRDWIIKQHQDNELTNKYLNVMENAFKAMLKG